MYVNQSENTACNFVSPAGLANAKNEVLFPVADVQSKDYAASIALTIKQMITFVTVATLTGALTLTASINAQVTKGAMLFVKLTSDGTARDTTLSTGITGTTVAGTISKSKLASFVYDGTTFVHIGTQQLN
jgi:hypothetical protein